MKRSSFWHFPELWAYFLYQVCSILDNDWFVSDLPKNITVCHTLRILDRWIRRKKFIFWIIYWKNSEKRLQELFKSAKNYDSIKIIGSVLISNICLEIEHVKETIWLVKKPLAYFLVKISNWHWLILYDSYTNVSSPYFIFALLTWKVVWTIITSAFCISYASQLILYQHSNKMIKSNSLKKPLILHSESFRPVGL